MLAASLMSLAVVGSLPDPCAGTDHFGKVTFTVSDGPTAFLQVFAEAEPAHACMRLGECVWGWTLSPEQSEEVNRFTSAASGPSTNECAAESTRLHDEPPYEGIVRVACSGSAEKVKPLLFARQFVESLGSGQCANEAVDSSAPGRIRLSGELAIVGATMCVAAEWFPATAAAAVSIGPSCPPPVSVAPQPGHVLVLASDGAINVSWQLQSDAGGWKLSSGTSASTTGTAYTQAWAAAVGGVLPIDVTLPGEDVLGDLDPTLASAPVLLGRWATAFSAPSDSYLDTVLRVWMARVALLNPTTADGTLYRRECATPATPPFSSCSP